MAALIETWTDDGHLQITDDQIYFILEQKVSFDGSNTGWGQYGNSGGTSRDVTFSGITLADAPMVAINSEAVTWARLISSTPTSLTYRISRGSSLAVNIFLFSKRRPPNDSGLVCLYADDGGCIFNSDFKVARPLGNYTQAGYSGIPIAGRTLAHVPQKLETANFNLFQNQGLGSCTINGNAAYQVTNTTGWSEVHVRAGVGVLDRNVVSSQIGPIQYACVASTSGVPLGQSYSSSGWGSLILDVTKY